MVVRYVTAALCVLALLCASGCEPRGTRDQGDPTTITIGYQIPTSQTWGALAIKNLKLYEHHLEQLVPGGNFRIEWFNSETGPPLNNGMVARKIQIAFMGDMPLLANGAISESNHAYSSALIALDGKGAGGKNQAMVVSSHSQIAGVRDLAGKTIVVPFGTSAHRMVLDVIHQYGISDEVTLVDLPITVGADQVRQGRADAVACWEPYPSLLVSRGTHKVLVGGEVTGIDYLDGVVVNKQWAEKNPQLIKAFLRALIEAHQLLNADHERAAQIFSHETGLPEEVCRDLAPKLWFDAAVYAKDRATLSSSADFLLKLGKLDRIDLDRFVDDSHIREAARSLGLQYLSDEELAGPWLKHGLR